MKRLGIVLSIVALGMALQVSAADGLPTGKFKYSVQKIWDEGTHAAFTSLEKFGGKYYCSFREGYSHIFDENGVAEGRIRILESKNGKTWKSVLDAGIKGIDCRDPKLSVTPDGRLMVIFDGSLYRDKKLISQECYVMFSKDGRNYSEPEKIKLNPAPKGNKNWLWRVTWNQGAGYGVSYGSDPLTLYKTTDGINYDLVRSFDSKGNETTLRFLPDGRMLMMIRNDSGDPRGEWGVAQAPYKDWKLDRMSLRVGGQDYLVLDDGTVLCGTRSYLIGNHCKTVILKGNLDGDFEEVFSLPSDYDTSYPGMLVVGDELWVSYYSTNGVRGKAAIFLARIPLAALL